MAIYRNRIVSSLIASAVALTAAAENIGRSGDDPPVSPGSKFVRKLWTEPVPAEVSRLFYLRAVVAIANDREGLARLDRFIQHAALLKVAGLPPPEGATIEQALRKLEIVEERERLLRLQVLERSLSASPHKPSVGEPAIATKYLRVDLSNTSSMSIRSFSAELRLRPHGRLDWVSARCRGVELRAPGERWTTDCEATSRGPPGDAAFHALIRDAAAHWKRGAAEARIASSAVTFTEHVLPGSEFTVVGDGGGYSGPGLNTVDLRESRDARAMAVGHLRNATCWERGTCSQELFHRWFNANPFTATMVVAFVVGFVLAVPIVVLFRRHSVKIAVVLSVGGGIAGIVTIFQSKFQSWSYHLWPLFVVAVPAIAVGLLIGAIVLRMFFIHARRDPKAT